MKIGAHKIKPCGKYFNNSIYVHKDYFNEVRQINADIVRDRMKYLPKDFKYNLIRYDKNTKNVSFINLINFDTADTPILGDSYLVRSAQYVATCIDGKKIRFTPMKADPQIKIHKWLYVPQNYKGFDWNASVAYSKTWLNISEFHKSIQKLSEWIEFLKDNKLPIENWTQNFIV